MRASAPARVHPFASGILNGLRFVAVDVGAANGLLSHWSVLERTASFYLFEPDEDAAEKLERAYGGAEAENFRVMPIALSGEGGRRTLFVTHASTGSSLLKPGTQHASRYVNPDYFEPVHEVPIDTRTLESVFDESKERIADILKLDVQGGELEILGGLGATRLASASGVEMEIGMPGAYQNQPQFAEIQAFMESHGLELFDVRCARAYPVIQGRDDHYQTRVFGVHRNSPTIAARLWEIDAVYFRSARALIERRDADAIRRLLIAYCTYNFYAEAYDLVRVASESGIFDAPNRSALERNIVGWHRSLHYRFYFAPRPIFDRLRALLYRFSLRSAPRWCQYTYQDYPSG